MALMRDQQVRRRSPKRSGSSEQAGFSLVEALVSSFLLMLAVSQSLSVFGVTMNALGASRIRDGLNAAIHADLEAVRNEVATWRFDTSVEGMTAYNLQGDSEACKTNRLAEKLLEEKVATLPNIASPISLGDSSVPSRGSSVERRITEFERPNGGTGDGNLIQVAYTTNPGSVVSIERKAVISIPAQGWCVYD